MSETLQCSFSLLDEGRKYTGNHRKYVIENAREICYSPATREKIRLREAFGYYGHGRRQITGQMDLPEVSVVKLPDGGDAIISNIPSNVCTAFDVDKDGKVTHSQDILDTDTGKIVSGLNASRVGGFSWACPGKDGGATGVTKLAGWSGFDYVLTPGFSSNRGYVLESSESKEQTILESVSAVVKDEKKAAQIVAGWKLPDPYHEQQLQDAVFEANEKFFGLQEKFDRLAGEVTTAISDKNIAQEALQHQKEGFTNVLESIQKALPFFIPEKAMAAMLDGDFERARPIFESATHFDFSQFPIEGAKNSPGAVTVPENNGHNDDKFNYGSAGYGFGINL